MDNLNRCICCSKKLQSHSSIMKCSACNGSYHIKCLSVGKKDSIYLNRFSNPWICVKCINESLPFNHLDDEDYYDCTVANYCHSIGKSLHELNESGEVFYSIDRADDDYLSLLYDIDPDEQYYRFLPGFFNTSVYFDETAFKEKCKESKITTNNFSLIHFNVRSASKFLSHVENYLYCLDHDFSVICLTETWYREHNVGLYDVKDYRQENNYRSKRGGGVSIMVRNGVDYRLRPDLEIYNEDIETIFVEIEGKSINSSKNHLVGVIYRPPNRDIDAFLIHLKIIMDKLKHCKQHCHLLGDYNINLLKVENHIPTSNFIDQMYSNSFIPLINKPTRVTDKSATLIDNIFTNRLSDTNTLQGILATDISDHFPVFVIFTEICQSNANKEEYIFKRSFSPVKISNFCQALGSTNWSDIFINILDPQEAFTHFHSYFVKLYNKFFPLKKVKIGYKTRKPWLTVGVKNSINTKNKLYIKSIKYPSAINKSTYTNYKNKLNYITRKLERDHIENLLLKHKSNLKRTWQIMKDILNRNRVRNCPPEYFDINGERVTDKNKIVNGFNNFYVNIGPNLCKSLPPSNTNPTSYLKERNMHSMFIENINELEIKKIVMDLKESAVGWDDLSAKVIKKCTSYILYPLTHVFNMSFVSGVFPVELKLAKVIPLFKGDSKYVLSNYRPVSVLPVFSFFLERLMYNRLISFINEHKILYKLQFGFRGDHSTAMALMALVDNITKSIDNGEFTIGVFLDFSKAFDCLNHDILFQKLEYYGVRDVALKWFTSYLNDRKQYVMYDKTKSDYKNISCGVPQGVYFRPPVIFIICK